MRVALLLLIGLLIGCSAPRARLSFPAAPLAREGDLTWYDVNRNGKRDFATSSGGTDRLDLLSYDDDEDGRIDRTYRLSDYADDVVPHLLILLDSIPYQPVEDQYLAGGLRLFGAPQKVIPPFPSLTEVCYTSVLHAPPLPGMIDRHYDPRSGKRRNGLWQRVRGYEQPWERRLHYAARFWEGGLSFLKPRDWYAAELERARAAMDESPDRVTAVYLWSAASMMCKYGPAGLEETLAGAERLCLQLLYERQGAIKITMMSDHGHNLTPSKNVRIDRLLTQAGLRVVDTLQRPDDVVLEITGLVTYAGVQTAQPQRVAEALLPHPEIELVMYKEAERVIVRSASGAAAIECSEQRVRYVPIDHDVLGYAPVLEKLGAEGSYATDEQWLAATADHAFPDAPRRIWDAFHGTAVNPPRVMFTLRDGYCAGLPEFERFIDMASTHGGLNQANSATFVMTMTRRPLGGPMRSRDVLGRVAPGFEPRVKVK